MTRNGKPIQGSPFKVQVGDKELGNASRVKVSGNALKEGKTQVFNEFSVDTKQAGKPCNLTALITSVVRTSIFV